LSFSTVFRKLIKLFFISLFAEKLLHNKQGKDHNKQDATKLFRLPQNVFDFRLLFDFSLC